MNTTVSQLVSGQLPQYVRDESPSFVKFLEYYYKSQEKTGLSQDILANLLNYTNIDKYDTRLIQGRTEVLESVSATDSTIIVESVENFLKENGSFLLDNEVVYYEKATSSPQVSLTPGISYAELTNKFQTLVNPYNKFDGITSQFAVTTESNLVVPPSVNHLLIKVYNEYLIPGVDFQLSTSKVTFTTPPRSPQLNDSAESTGITYLKGFFQDNILVLDNLDAQFDGETKTFNLTSNGQSYKPILTEYTVVILNRTLLSPKIDYNINDNTIIFKTAPASGSKVNIRSIEAPILSYGSGASGVAQIGDDGSITGIKIKSGGTNYKLEYPPQVTIVSEEGSGAVASSLVNGLKNIQLLGGGKGYSHLNPPIVNIESPTDPAGAKATAVATVDEDGFVDTLTLTSSGSRYTFTPRITFEVPGGGSLTQPNVDSDGQLIASTIQIENPGRGYSVPPEIYIDEPVGENPIPANISVTINAAGQIDSVTLNNAGRGYSQSNPPRIRVIEHNQAQVLDVTVDGAGRVIDVEVLNGGIGFDDVPSIYIIDDRLDPVTGVPIGGTGAKAVATIFNGSITDINITEFGTGYSTQFPPQVVIQRPPSAKASATVGFSEVTGFQILETGSGYTQAKFEGCVRGVSGLAEYDSAGNAIFENSTTAIAHEITPLSTPQVSSLDGLFIQKMISKFAEQYLPNIPTFDYESVDVVNIIKNIRKFYATKGTRDSVAFLFKLLYGENIEISYPKEQIVKPSAATWTVDTVLRCILISGDPRNITDGVLTQVADDVDTNIKDASALIENYLTIKTSSYEIYELILSDETIEGEFAIPYKTRLCEGIGEKDEIIIVDSTVGWPERNGVFVINGTEKVRYKEKSLNQFIECTRGIDGTTARKWDAATEVQSDTFAYINKGTPQEVKIQIVGIVEAEETVLSDDGSYYLTGDKLTVAKLGSTENIPQLKSWIYNVKKLVQVDSIEFGGLNNRTATVVCGNPHGLLVGDQVTVYGANPNLYNGTFLVQSREDDFIFKYQLPQPASTAPQGNILISVDLNRGKSDADSIQKIISNYTTNIQNTFFNKDYVYIAASGIPNYKVGPFNETALIPGNQRKLYRLPKSAETISTKDVISPGPIGSWVNGVSIWSYKSEETKIFGALTAVGITNPGSGYDASSPPVLSIEGGGGAGAEGYVIVNGSVTEIEVLEGGSGYTSSPLVSIVGGGGEGASATAIVTKGVVSRILVNSGGTGFTSRPEITIVGGGGLGATARAQVRGPIKEIVVSDGGVSYTSEPNITLSSGDGAAAQAIVSNGRIISIAIVAAGNGYTTPPEVAIYGEGFGAIARANIDTDGENAGRVTSIEILNRGIGYESGTTVVVLTSVGSGATFDSKVFEWTYNLQTNSDFDEAYGAVFEGYNTQYGGEYAHIANPQRLRYVLGDNMILDTNNLIREQEVGLEHSPIIGWAFDGNPIYGPYGYDDPTDQSSAIRRMSSSYSLVPNLIYNEDTNPSPERIDGPSLIDNPIGAFVEDFQYNFGTGDLDQYNGRFCKTPDFPNGRYCYFVTIDASEAGNPVFPYVLGPAWNSVVDSWNLVQTAVQQNIPGGIVRYRDPYENVDIDVERTPNAEIDTITYEDGDFIQLEIEDENRDSIIDEIELVNVNTFEEEDKLEVFDYFPTVKFDSRVDIEVETTTKFEDAKVDGFIIENPGQNYQVNDVLLFDNEETDGYGVSARVSKIEGKTIESYGYEMINDIPHGVITTAQPHELKVGDDIFVDYTPIRENTNKEFKVSVVKGIEELNVEQIGTGYTSEVPITVEIDGDGSDAIIQPKLNTATGNIVGFDIINSGNGFTSNPRILVSHPQVFKKADYYLNRLNGTGDETIIHNVVSTNNKDTYVVGKTKDAVGNWFGFLAKYNQTGILVWHKSLRSNYPNITGDSYCELTQIYVDESEGNSIIVAGHTKPNGINPAHNPDIVIAKYNQNNTGLLATLQWQREYAGISGISRGDYVTSLTKVTADRYIIGGYTDTNTSSAFDAFLIVINELGNFVAKRKFTSLTRSEKILDVVIHHETDGQEIDRIYYLMETAPNSSSEDKSLVIGKAQLTQFGLVSNTLNQISNTGFAFDRARMTIDEFNELWITAEAVNKTNLNRKNFWVGKYTLNSVAIWNYLYECNSANIDSIRMVSGNIDLFNHMNIGLEVVRSSDKKVLNHFIKISYNGSVDTNYQVDYTRGIEGVSWYASHADVSGDQVLVGQEKHNRTVALFDFELDPLTTQISFADTTQKVTNATWMGDYSNSIGKGSTSALDVQGYDIDLGQFAASYFKIESADAEPLYGVGDFTSKNFTISGWFNASSQYVTQGYTGTNPVLMQFGDWTGAGLSVVWDRTGASGNTNSVLMYANATSLYGSSPIVSTSNVFVTDTWNYIVLTKNSNTYTLHVNGIQVCQATSPGISLNNNLYVANAPGYNNVAGQFVQSSQFSGYIDGIKVSDRVLSAAPATTTAQFATYYSRVDYIHTEGLIHKVDKVTGPDRTGEFTANGITFNKTNGTNVTRGSALVINKVGYALASEGYQVLDYNDVASTLTQDIANIANTNSIWTTRTATIPAPGSKKVKVSPKAYGKFFMSQSGTSKLNNVQQLVTNSAEVNITKGSTLQVWNNGSIAAQAKVISVDTTAHPNTINIADIVGEWDNYLNQGELRTSALDVNEIKGYVFPQVVNTTPGTFDFSLANESWTLLDANATNNLHEFARFKPHDDRDYSVRIDAIGGSSEYVVGSVVTLTADQLSFNSSYNTLEISGLIGVTTITLITNLEKLIKYSAINNTSTAFAATFTDNYLKENDIIYIEGNSGDGQPNDYDGSFFVEEVFTSREFTFKLRGVPTDEPAENTNGVGDVIIYAKTPVLPMFYGHQYLFDMSHPSLVGYYLTFSKDNLYKLEYSFNAIERGGTPGVLISGTKPYVKLAITEEVTNISYYFDPSRVDDESPTSPNAYLDVQYSPYVGKFRVEQLSGATITSGAVTMKFPLAIEPEGPADIETASYSTSAESAVGPISDIRIVSGGGFYKKLPVVSGIQSSRKIERIQIADPGTEYALGTYFSVPIQGDGEGGYVQITVEDGLDEEGQLIPGQISQVVVTSPGKNYTEAFIDIEAIPGILGPSLQGSGGELTVVIPPAGTGASIFVRGDKVGKIKKLKNNNFGFDYPQDYTLRPEISFPVNLQLINTSILQSIKVTDPGSGYSQAPTVIIEGGGGSGATAVANIKNGRIESIEVKDPGAGYSSEPSISLNSAFSYVINLDLNLFQFSFPHGIPNGAEVQLRVEDNGDGDPAFGITAFGPLIQGQTYYAITGITNGLEGDQMRLALTPDNAALGDFLNFVNAGTGRQILLTASFGGKAEAIITIGQFLAGERIYQGESLEDASAFGYISDNDGWQPGPKILKVVDYTGEFSIGENITGTISKASGTIDNLSIAKGVLNISAITKTPGKFIDDVGKPSEIIQKIQDSYYFQDFSYSIKSSISIDKWRDIISSNVHPAGFKIFGELGLAETATIENKEIDFELVKSVNLTDSAVVPNIQNFTLVEPIYTDFTNTEVLFRQKRLTSSEQILTSVVQRLDDISNLFDGVKFAFPLTVEQNQIIATTSQLMVVLNGIIQTPGSSFEVQGDQIVFSEPPQPPASVKYVELGLDFKEVYNLQLSTVLGTYPPTGYRVTGVITGNDAIVIRSGVNSMDIIYPDQLEGIPLNPNKKFRVGVVNTIGPVQTSGLNYVDENNVPTLGGSGTGLTVDVNVDASGQVTSLTLNTGGRDYKVGDIITVAGGDLQCTFEILVIQGEEIRSSQVGFSGFVDAATLIENQNLFEYQENITDFGGDIASVEAINLDNANSEPISTLSLSLSASATFVYVSNLRDEDSEPVFAVDKQYQFDSEIFTVQEIDYNNNRLTVLRGELGTSAVSHQANTKIYSTEIIRTNTILVSKTTGTYQSKPGLFNINTDEYIISARTGIVAQVVTSAPYKDPVTSTVVPQVNISDGSSFFGLLFNRLVSPDLPNVILDNISESQIQVSEVDDMSATFNDKFPSNEVVRNTYMTYNPATVNGSGFELGETLRNFKIRFGGQTANFITDEEVRVNKLAFFGEQGDLINAGQIVRSSNATVEVIGANYGRKWLYLGKQARASTLLHTINFNGNAKISTTQYKFGGTSLYLDGNGDYLSLDSSDEFAFGTGQFTVECWVRLNSASITGPTTVWDFRQSATEVAGRLHITSAQVRYNVNGVDLLNSGATLLTQNTWHHIAVSREGNGADQLRLFVDGIECGIATDTNTYVAKPLVIGSTYDINDECLGYIDEFRVSTTARYTTSFTAPVGVYQGDTDTVFLTHFDGENNATETQDWSGVPTYSYGDEFVNTDVPFRYYDAADLIDANADIIADEAVEFFKNIGAGHSDNFTFPNNDAGARCKIDVKLILNAITENIRNGGNSIIWDAAAFYRVEDENNPALATLSHVEGEVTQSLYVMRIAEDIAIATMRNQFGIDNLRDNPGSLTYNAWNSVADRYVDASNEISNNINYIAEEALARAITNFPGTTATLNSECADDIKDTLKALVINLAQDGNNHMWDAAWWFLNGGSFNHITTNLTETVWTLNTARDLAIEIMRGQPSSTQGGHGLTPVIDNTITIDPSNPRCADVASTIGVLMQIVTDSLQDPAGADSVTYPYSITTTGETGRIRPSKWPIRYSNIYTNDDVFRDSSLIIDPLASPTNQLFCANVATAIEDLFEVVTETIVQADAGNNYLNTVPRIAPSYPWAGGSVSGFITVPLIAGTVDNINDYIVTYQVGEDGRNRFKDAANILRDNLNVIVDEVIGRMLAEYPDLAAFMPRNQGGGSDAGTTRCRTDLILIANAVIDDLEQGGNLNTIQGVKFYIDSNGGIQHIRLQLLFSLFAHEQLNLLMQDAVAGTLSAQYSSSVVVPPIGISVDDKGGIVQSFTPSNASYDASTGNLVLTIGTHDLVVGSAIWISPESIRFTCTSDGNLTQQSYPRLTDPAYDTYLYVSAVTGTTITVNVGASPIVTYNVSDATYNPVTGNAELNIGSHNLKVGTSIKLAANSLTFTCALDNYATQHSYPRATDPAYNTSIVIQNVTANTITINVGASSDTSEHRFVSATAGAVVSGGNYVHTFAGAEANSITTAGNCADVKAAIDTLLTQMNDILAPTGARYIDACNLIWKNQDYIAEEAVGALDAYFTYTINDVDYSTFGYPGGTADGRPKCIRDVKFIISNVITDLLTGGNSNTIMALESYVDTNRKVLHVEDQLTATIWALDYVKFLVHKAINNHLQQQGQVQISDNHYLAQYTTRSPYTDDTITHDISADGGEYLPGDCIDVHAAIETLMVMPGEFLTPAGSQARDAMNQILFNEHYYKEEIAQKVKLQWGINEWNTTEYEGMIDTLTDDIIYDVLTTPISERPGDKYQDAAYLIETNRDFIAEETVYLLQQEYPSLNIPGGPSNCSDDIKDILDCLTYNLRHGGNHEIWDAAALYVDRTWNTVVQHVETEVEETLWALNKAKDLAIDVMRNVHIVKQGNHNEIQVKNHTITVDTNVPYCFEVAQSITTLMDIIYQTIYQADLDGTDFLDTVTRTTPTRSTNYNNTETLETLRTLPNLTNYEGSSANILENTIWGQINENFNLPSYQTPGGWYRYYGWIDGTQYEAPDGTLTADKWIPNTSNGIKVIYYNHPLSTYSTFDGNGVTLDSTSATFDTGAEGSVQRFTYSCFYKAAGYGQVRFHISWGASGLAGQLSNYSYAFFNFNLQSGAKSSNFISGITVHDMNVIPYGDGWYRCYCTFDVPYGIAEFRVSNYMAQSLINGVGNGTSGILIWGAKLNAGNLDAYEANTNADKFYTNKDYNIRSYILDELSVMYNEAMDKNLTSPSPNASFPAYYKDGLRGYDSADYMPQILDIIEKYRSQFKDAKFYESLTQNSGLSFMEKTYVEPGARVIPAAISGGLVSNEYIYGTLSNAAAETGSISANSADLVKKLIRIRYTFVETDPNLISEYQIGMTVTDILDVNTTGTIYAMYEDENYKYIDIVDEGTTPWTVGVNFIDMTNSEEANVDSLEYRLVVVRPSGAFNASEAFKGYSSGTTGIITQYYDNNAAVLDNTGGKLTIDTDTIQGSFENTSVIYADESEFFIEAYKHDGSGSLSLSDKVISAGYVELTVTVYNDTFNNIVRNNFYLGAQLFSIVDNVPQAGVKGIVSGWNPDTNTVYVSMIEGAFQPGNIAACYIGGGNPVGQGTIGTVTNIASQFTATVVSIVDFIQYERIYLTGVKGTLNNYDTIVGPNNYKSAITKVQPIEGRVSRFFIGFDGQQTNFKLTINNGQPYFPDPAGHLMVYVNGVLQPPGASNAFTAFSDEIQFSEAPESGSAFTGYYVGKLRYLNDISYEFDSLRSSFNLLYEDSFYSLTLTEGVQSTVIRPENNIIVSLNGVLQEPGVGFELVGSRIIFSEVPRFGSTFVAFSYIGSDADVVAATVVPPLEAGDKLVISGETEDREIAIIESSNSLITFDYLGSVFGRDGAASSQLLKGRITDAQITSPGDGYTTRPVVRVDSTSGFDGQLKALVGVQRIDVKVGGERYGYPLVSTENEIPDGYIYPNINQYPAEGIPTILATDIVSPPIFENVPPQSGLTTSAADGISTLDNEKSTLAGEWTPSIVPNFNPAQTIVSVNDSITNFVLDQGILEISTSGTPSPALYGVPLGSKSFPDLGLQVAAQNENYNFVYRGGTNSSNPMHTGIGGVGMALNGVLIETAFDNSATLPTTNFQLPTGFYWNRVFHEDKYGVDACGGAPNQLTGEYSYRSGSFLMNCWTRKFYRSTPYLSDYNFKSNFYRHGDGHSKIIGWSADGFPIYGPFGYRTPTENNSGTARMKSSYRLLTTEAYGREYDYIELPPGSFINDYEFVYGLGDLDVHNGRFCVTPEFPQGTYAYFMTIDANGNPIFPYIIGNATRQQRPNGFNESQIEIIALTAQIIDDLENPEVPPTPPQTAYQINNFDPTTIWSNSYS